MLGKIICPFLIWRQVTSPCKDCWALWQTSSISLIMWLLYFKGLLHPYPYLALPMDYVFLSCCVRSKSSGYTWNESAFTIWSRLWFFEYSFPDSYREAAREALTWQLNSNVQVNCSCPLVLSNRKTWLFRTKCNYKFINNSSYLTI